jgi:hypothetical protein
VEANEVLTRLDGETDQVGGLEVQRRVPEELVLVAAVLELHVDVAVDAGRLAVLVVPLEELGLLTTKLAADGLEHGAEVLVLGRVGAAVEARQRVDGALHLGETRGVAGANLGAEHVEAVQVEVGRELGLLRRGVVHRDVAERDGGLLVVVGLVVDAGATVLDHHHLVGLGDEAEVAVERADHAGLELRQLARRVGSGGLGAALGSGRADLALAALVLRLVQVVVAEHGGVGGVGRVLTARV